LVNSYHLFTGNKDTVATKTSSETEVETSFGQPTEEKSGGKSEGVYTDIAGLGANQIALSIVTSVVLLAIALVLCHFYKKKRK